MSLYNSRTTPGATGNTGTGFYLSWARLDRLRQLNAMRRYCTAHPYRYQHRSRP